MKNLKTQLYFRPAHGIALGYLSYILIGTFLLWLPSSQEHTTDLLNHIFMAASAASTTGLVTVDPGSTYTWFGELVLLLLIQFGGLGYMTASSFLLLASQKKLSQQRVSILKGAFSLPQSIGAAHILRNMVVFTIICEVLGALALLPYFIAADVAYPVWSALFHSISAFCTAGFSLFPTGLEGFRGHIEINLIISSLSYLGGIGFIVITDLWERLRGHRDSITFTSKVIIGVTVLTALWGTLTIYFLASGLNHLPKTDRLLAAFFQSMSASTTVGFNTISVGQLSLPVIVVLYFLMLFGASPAGTGGGLKSTALTALLADIWSHLRGYKKTYLFGREIPKQRIQTASISAITYGMVLGLGVFALSVAMPTASFEWIVFEALSAISTVGLSMGLTSELNTWGKWIVIALMFVGRLGVITFGLLLVSPKHEGFRKRKQDDLAV